MNPHLRTALRWVVYIRTMGGEPIPFQHGSHREWALALQRQHEQLRLGVAPEFCKTAKLSARALIKQKGYRRAANEAVPVSVCTSSAAEPWGGPDGCEYVPADTNDPRGQLLSAKEPRALKRAENACCHKVRHPHHLSAVLHAIRLGKDVRVFECQACGFLHVGHDPETPGTRDYRRARKRLRAVEKRLLALDDEWIRIVREKQVLLRKFGEPDVPAAMMSEIAGQIRRLAKLLKLCIGIGQ